MSLSPRRPLGAFLFLSLFFLCTAARAVDQTALIQLVEYVGADYVNAVEGGEIVSQAEYDEMVEFSDLLDEGIRELPDEDGKADLLERASSLKQAVAERADNERIRTLTQAIRAELVGVYGLPVIPRDAPDMQAAADLYQSQCAACHGPGGEGDGPAGAGLEPAPTDFTEEARYRGRSLLGLYTTITDGVDDTGMTAFRDQLSEQQRWALAFYVGGLAVTDQQSEQGKAALQQNRELKTELPLDAVIGKGPAEVREEQGEAAYRALGYLRGNPEALFSQNRFIDISRENLEQARQTYRDGDQAGARQHALAAYLDGFEMIEQQLAALDDDAMRRAERRFMAVREAIERGREAAAVDQAVDRALTELEAAADLLDGDGLSPAATFSASFFILFREGLEALLIVAALLTFTRKARATTATRYIHLGWVGALLAGVATWFVASRLISFSGASRELTEGVAGLLAALILFYVGFWMHTNSNSQKWLGYLKGKVDNALGGGTVWALALVSFVSVYREMFETILFYQALWTQVTSATQPFLVYGLGAALVALAVVCVLIFRIGMRLPLGVFFKITSLILLVLSVILLGKGIAALQEAGTLPARYLAGLPTVEWLGFFPTVQGVAAQAVAVVLAVLAWLRGRSVDGAGD